MKPNQVNRRMFINTMVFAVVSVIALIVLLVLFIVFQNMPLVVALTPLMLTVIVGLLGVVVYCLLKINVFEDQIGNLIKNADDHELNPDHCPDYFTASRNSDNEIVCTNGYDAPRSQASFKFVSFDADAPVPESLNLSDYQGMKLNKACAALNPSDETDPVHNIPWTDVRAKCRSISDGYV